MKKAMKKSSVLSRRENRLRENAVTTKKPLSKQDRDQFLAEIDAIRDENIDTSDIPEITEEQWRTAVRGRFYRPVKTPVTLRLEGEPDRDRALAIAASVR